ncbi:MAG: FCD domain-containing protein [Alphaproteobacteria bacterium]|nr:FCD domain-containing protein [Alphaproteobacteria bacterium]MBU0802028.1 FCD domain-containing protein [Alphaproteobacteria bacterium]MBU0872365.1 FCD domain-containing protein [Alphaproteobacteria bacterium]MBU1399527.1 FCD domain-containing protein [Alphaproteobacteria bacterium]MBU1589913.1 FCD domain-containing protein [Alphaproteobacteria bacterium]
MAAFEPKLVLSDVDDIIGSIRQIQKEGRPLPSERDLAEQLNVKRHQLRKALEAMRRAGDLKPARTRRAPTAWPRYGEELVRVTNPIEVLELRLLIEPGLARLASLRASSFETARILEAATTPENAESGEADLAFHLAIAGAARNHLAAEIYRMLRQVGVDARVKVARTAAPTCPKRIAQRDAEHRQVAEAISQRDPEAAETAMRAHLLSVQKQIVERSNAGAFAA